MDPIIEKFLASDAITLGNKEFNFSLEEHLVILEYTLINNWVNHLLNKSDISYNIIPTLIIINRLLYYRRCTQGLGDTQLFNPGILNDNLSKLKDDKLIAFGKTKLNKIKKIEKVLINTIDTSP